MESITSETTLLDLYSGCGAMSTGLCLGANSYGVKLVSVSFQKFHSPDKLPNLRIDMCPLDLYNIIFWSKTPLLPAAAPTLSWVTFMHRNGLWISTSMLVIV